MSAFQVVQVATSVSHIGKIDRINPNNSYNDFYKWIETAVAINSRSNKVIIP